MGSFDFIKNTSDYPHIGYRLYRWEAASRQAGLWVSRPVGAGGLGRLLTEALVAFDYQGILTILLVFVGLTLVVDLVSAAARRALT